ncbi:MAG: hydroxymethylbilane synthase [Armatimonadota bacterium]
MSRVLKVGTRGSKLALAQTEWVINALKQKFSDLQVETVIIRTKGDVIADRPLREVAGKGFFVKEIEVALLRGEIDFAVHSLKDMPTDLPEGLTIAALCNRVEPRDVLVVRGWQGENGDLQEIVKQMPEQAKVGTSSLRRQAQIKIAFPSWQLCELRGNVDTRLRKLDEGQYDAIVVAAAGLIRLGLQKRITCILPVEVCCPAAGQGALAVEARSDDEEVLKLLQAIDDLTVRVEVEAERAATKTLGAGCHSAIGALARLNGRELAIWVVAAQPDGQKVWRNFAHVSLPENTSTWLERARELGVKAAKDLMEQGAIV